NIDKLESLDSSFVSGGAGKLESVPDSRSAIFKSRSLLGPEKYQLMNFFKLIHWKILIICTKGVVKGASLPIATIGFSNANGAIIYPIYGQGELSQAFCRRAAVKGCIYVLRMPITALIMDKDGRTYQGVRLASGQELSSPLLILAPSFTIPKTSSPGVEVTNSNDKSPSNAEGNVARGICIAKNSVKSEAANCLVFFPPRSLYPEQKTSVRVLQLSSNVGICPSNTEVSVALKEDDFTRIIRCFFPLNQNCFLTFNHENHCNGLLSIIQHVLLCLPNFRFVTYLSAVCDEAVEGKKLLNAAVNALFHIAVSSSPENNEIDNLREHTEEKPCLLWSALYIQDLTKFHGAACNSIRFTPMPDEHLHYDDILDATEKLFKELFPNEDFFATASTSDSDEHLDDGNTESDP
ncbi:rab escort protein 1-like, partial [Salvia splendens]|uniref:rab escort protein 1-like n=1 Tax=Salvia splendens TaxID=180675 RepID=UPI001C255620